MVTKMVALALVASIDLERDDAQTAYAKNYELVRADSIGAWSQVIQDLTTAPVYRLLTPSARQFHSSLTQRFGRESDCWQRSAIDKLNEASACFPTLAADQAPGKVSAAQWFSIFAALRNKTRGHGADLVAWQSEAAASLGGSLQTLVDSLECFVWDWWQIRRTAAGVPKLHRLSRTDAEFPDDVFDCTDGIYLTMGGPPKRVDLLTSNADSNDFFLPNGDAQDNKNRYEALLPDRQQTMG